MQKLTLASRLLQATATKLLLGILFLIGGYILSQFALDYLLKEASFSKDISGLITAIISSIVALIVYILLYKWLEKRKITELSTFGIGKQLLYGVLIGGMLQSLTILFIYIKGGYTVTAVNSLVFIIPSLAMSFSAAIFEELLFRGILFRLIEEKLGTYLSLIISAMFFGLIHLLNPNSNLIAALGLVIQAGLLLGAAYAFSRSLWFPIAIHFAWNFAQSGIFGATVSGNTITKSFLTSDIHGSVWYTGGSFGPEGSVQATVFCLIAAIILMVLTVKRKNIIVPYWHSSKV